MFAHPNGELRAFVCRKVVAGTSVVLRTIVFSTALVIALSACDDRPEDYLPEQAAATAEATPPTLQQVGALRNALRNCERAMEAGSDQIAGVAARESEPATPELIEKARDACAGSARMIDGLPIWGRLKDPCLRAAYAREAVAERTLRTLASPDQMLGVSALRNEISDQVAASRACASEIQAAEQNPSA